jgi:hypothetical protein
VPIYPIRSRYRSGTASSTGSQVDWSSGVYAVTESSTFRASVSEMVPLMANHLGDADRGGDRDHGRERPAGAAR